MSGYIVNFKNQQHMMSYQEIDINDDYPIAFASPEGEVEFKMQVEKWYEQYGDIYTTEVNENIFVFRQISMKEYKNSIKLYPDILERAEYVCRLAVLEPLVEDYSSEIYGGIPEILSKQILFESGFDGEDKIMRFLQTHEMEINNDKTEQMILVIREIFPDIAFEVIEGWTLEKISKYYSRAKWALENLRGTVLEGNEN